MLSLKNVHIFLNDVEIVNDVSLTLSASECLVILGANGAGKSTLVSALCGHLPYHCGSITLNNYELNTLDPNAIARQVALVPQQQEMAFPFTAIEMVTMGCTPFLSAFESPGHHHHTQAKQILAGINAQTLADKPFNKLSGGERQLVQLSRALLQSRNILVLDEPTNHLDYHNQYRILAAIKQACRQRNLAVVVILHDPNQAQLIADKILMLEKGKVMAYGNVGDVMTPANISRLYSLPSAATPIGEINWFMPLNIMPKQSPRLLLVTGESGSGKTTLLQSLIRKLSGRLRIQGFITPGEMQDGVRSCCDIVDLYTGNRCEFGRRTNQFDESTQTRFVFSEEGLYLANQALCHSEIPDLCIIDEIGPMEFAGKGVSGALAKVLAKPGCIHIWVIRPSLLEALPELTGFTPHAVIHAGDPDGLDQLIMFIDKERS